MLIFHRRGREEVIVGVEQVQIIMLCFESDGAIVLFFQRE